MSRALGDLQYKNPINTMDISGTPKSKRANAALPGERGNFLSNKPHVRTVELDSDSRYALLCSTDGVSDMTDERMLMEEVMGDFIKGQKAAEIANAITNVNARLPRSDNCTCIVAFIDGIETLPA